MDSDLASGNFILKPAGTGSTWHEASFCIFSQKPSLQPPTNTKPCHTNPIHTVTLFYSTVLTLVCKVLIHHIQITGPSVQNSNQPGFRGRVWSPAVLAQDKVISDLPYLSLLKGNTLSTEFTSSTRDKHSFSLWEMGGVFCLSVSSSLLTPNFQGRKWFHTCYSITLGIEANLLIDGIHLLIQTQSTNKIQLILMWEHSLLSVQTLNTKGSAKTPWATWSQRGAHTCLQAMPNAFQLHFHNIQGLWNLMCWKPSFFSLRCSLTPSELIFPSESWSHKIYKLQYYKYLTVGNVFKALCYFKCKHRFRYIISQSMWVINVPTFPHPLI